VRTRLAVILFVPSLLLLVLLGMAYAVSAARSEQQQVYVDRLGDASYLGVVARQSLRADDPALIRGDLQRYQEVYGVEAAIVDSSGRTWATNGLAVEDVEARFAALSGRRAELDPAVLPWEVDRIVIAEPIFEGGDLAGAVITVSDVDHVSHGIWRNWALIIGLAVVLSAGALLIANRTASWVLRPVRRVERAMSEIGDGQLAARIPESVGPPELRAVTARFNEMAERVEHLVRKQREFVHNASHELRNPLTALSLRVEELELTAPREHVTEVAAVRAEAQRLRHILDALLMLAEDAAEEVDPDPVDVTALVGERVESWRHLAPHRTLELSLPDGELLAVASTTAVECALDAVIDNALKFSPGDRPVEVAVAADGASVAITVRDHGAGLAPEQLASATERFWRGPGHRTVQGSGLGLAIAAELLRSRGGDVRLDLPEGGGLRVRLDVHRVQEDT
jgi:signal transduction histidine kinase